MCLHMTICLLRIANLCFLTERQCLLSLSSCQFVEVSSSGGKNWSPAKVFSAQDLPRVVMTKLLAAIIALYHFAALRCTSLSITSGTTEVYALVEFFFLLCWLKGICDWIVIHHKTSMALKMFFLGVGEKGKMFWFADVRCIMRSKLMRLTIWFFPTKLLLINVRMFARSYEIFNLVWHLLIRLLTCCKKFCSV